MVAILGVGIDLGNTHSVAACVNAQRRSAILRDREGQIAIPSVVLFEDDRTIVGEEARLRAKGRAARLASCIKQEIGQDRYSHPISGLRLPPEVIQACILNKIRVEAERRIGNQFPVVIAVPTYFNDVQRRVTVEAGEMAGLQVVDVIHEPVAAALAFSEDMPPLSGAGRPQSRQLVFDLGGYTFEVALLECDGTGFKTLGTERDEHLGGNDWDRHLVDYLAEQFIRQHGIDPRENPSSLERLLAAAARSKVALGLRAAATIRIVHAGHLLDIQVTRQQFADLTADLRKRAMDRCEQLLKSAGVDWRDLSRVMLVGGGTRLPAIREMLEQRTGFPPSAHVNPEEAVARGAALYAAQYTESAANPSIAPRFTITNVTTHSLGIEGVDANTGRRVNRILIPRGTQLPARAKRDFIVRVTDDRSLTIQVLEGDHKDPAFCTTIGRAILRDLPLEIDQEWPVEVILIYDAQGRISVDARVRYTDHAVHLETLRVGGLSVTHRERWKAVVMSAPGLTWYRETLLANQNDGRSTPIALASSSPEDLVSADSGTASESDGPSSVWSFLQRNMPFFFRSRATRSSAETGADDEADSATAARTGTAPSTSAPRNREPPMLEILD